MSLKEDRSDSYKSPAAEIAGLFLMAADFRADYAFCRQRLQYPCRPGFSW